MPEPDPASAPDDTPLSPLAGMEGYDATIYGRSFADVYDHWYADVSDIDGTVAMIRSLAEERSGGPVLELGIGSGRLALPLAAGPPALEVVGLDASVEMIEQLRAKPSGSLIDCVLGDMAAIPFRSSFDVVFVAFNTICNLATEADQRRCVEGAAAALRPGGAFVVEAFVPPLPGEAPRAAVAPRSIELDHVILTATLVDEDAQLISGQHIDITETDGVRLRPWQLRYLYPEQLDGLAEAAGLTLKVRSADWAGTPFSSTADVHVSVYVRDR